MHTITVTGHDPGDYLHPEQRLELIDEETGNLYELYVRSNARAPARRGEISLFIPVTAIQGVQTDKKYCVVTLSRAANAKEETTRKEKLPGALAVSTDNGSAKTSARKRSKR